MLPSCVCSVHHLKEAVGILVTEVNVDHLQQHSDFVVAHLVVVVLVGPAQVSVNPGGRRIWSRKWQALESARVPPIGPLSRPSTPTHNKQSDLVTPATARGGAPRILYQVFTSYRKQPAVGQHFLTTIIIICVSSLPMSFCLLSHTQLWKLALCDVTWGAAISLTPSDRCLFCPKRQTCGRSDKALVLARG